MYRLQLVIVLLLQVLSVSMISGAASADEGKLLYRESCVHCHGEFGEGSSTGPSLLFEEASALKPRQIMNLISTGRPEKGMPAFDFEPAQRMQLLGYILTLQDNASDESASASGAKGEPTTVDKGKLVFWGSGRCSECHSVHNRGGISAPDLTQVAAQMTRPQLLEAIQEPSLAIASGYEASEIVMLDGTVVRGWSRYATADTVQLFDPDQQLWTTYFDKDLQSRRQLATSLMPEDLLHALTEEETNALLDYLSSLQGS